MLSPTTYCSYLTSAVMWMSMSSQDHPFVFSSSLMSIYQPLPVNYRMTADQKVNMFSLIFVHCKTLRTSLWHLVYYVLMVYVSFYLITNIAKLEILIFLLILRTLRPRLKRNVQLWHYYAIMLYEWINKTIQLCSARTVEWHTIIIILWLIALHTGEKFGNRLL